MKDYSIEYKLNSVMDGLVGSAIENANGKDQVMISIPFTSIMSLELYGIKHSHLTLYNMVAMRGLDCFVNDKEKGKKSIIIASHNLKHYKNIIRIFYKFCKEIANIQDKIVVEMEDEGRVLIDLPIVSLLECEHKVVSKETILLLNIIRDKLGSEFGYDAFDSVGLVCDNNMSTKLSKNRVTIDFIDKDDYLDDMESIKKIYDIVMSASTETLDIIFKDYKKGEADE